MRIIEDIKLDFSDVLIQPKRSILESRKEVDLTREFKFKHTQKKWIGVPIVASNMDTVGTISMHLVLANFGMLTCLHKFIPLERMKSDNNFYDNYSIVSTGITDNDLLKLDEILNHNYTNFICIDVANGYTERFLCIVKKLRDKYQNHIIIAGNVVTPEMTEALILAGADIVKVGIGSGAACTTRMKTGVGYPQLSAIIECADAAHGLNGHVMSDGGCVTSGDVAKAFGAGADFVMLGSMLSGHNESEKPIIEKDGKHYLKFYGMSSNEAMIQHYGKVDEYRTSEGRELLVPFKGSVDNTIKDILGGLRSACTYVGARSLKELPKRTTFIRVNNQLNTSLVDR